MNQRLVYWIVGALVTAFLLAPSVSAHLGGNFQSSNGYGFVYDKTCQNRDALLPQSKTCPGQIEAVSSSVQHVHLTYVFPYLGIATLEANLQEQTPIVGDYVTYYDLACSTGMVPYTSTNGVTCVGGQLRDWHAGTNHKFTGRGNENACVPLYCKWAIAVNWY